MTSDIDIDLLAAAIIAAGMYANANASDWTSEEVAHDAVEVLRKIRRELYK